MVEALLIIISSGHANWHFAGLKHLMHTAILTLLPIYLEQGSHLVYLIDWERNTTTSVRILDTGRVLGLVVVGHLQIVYILLKAH